eukprot:Nk52_evm11s358 gene=Nk52_evmTU11s358
MVVPLVPLSSSSSSSRLIRIGVAFKETPRPEEGRGTVDVDVCSFIKDLSDSQYMFLIDFKEVETIGGLRKYLSDKLYQIYLQQRHTEGTPVCAGAARARPYCDRVLYTNPQPGHSRAVQLRLLDSESIHVVRDGDCLEAGMRATMRQEGAGGDHRQQQSRGVCNTGKGESREGVVASPVCAGCDEDTVQLVKEKKERERVEEERVKKKKAKQLARKKKQKEKRLRGSKAIQKIPKGSETMQTGTGCSSSASGLNDNNAAQSKVAEEKKTGREGEEDKGGWGEVYYDRLPDINIPSGLKEGMVVAFKELALSCRGVPELTPYREGLVLGVGKDDGQGGGAGEDVPIRILVSRKMLMDEYDCIRRARNHVQLSRFDMDLDGSRVVMNNNGEMKQEDEQDVDEFIYDSEWNYKHLLVSPEATTERMYDPSMLSSCKEIIPAIIPGTDKGNEEKKEQQEIQRKRRIFAWKVKHSCS